MLSSKTVRRRSARLRQRGTAARYTTMADATESLRTLRIAHAELQRRCRKQSKQAKRSIRNDRRVYINDVREQVGLPALEEGQRRMKRRKRQA